MGQDVAEPQTAPIRAESAPAEHRPVWLQMVTGALMALAALILLVTLLQYAG